MSSSVGVQQSVRPDPLRGRARWAVVGLAVAVCSLLVSIGVDWLEIGLTNRVLSGATVSVGDLHASDTRQAVARLAYVAGLIVGAVFFIRWFSAAYRNLSALGHGELRFGRGWAIGGWFTPFLSLWRPKQLANDIWNGSDPHAPSFSGSGWKDAAAPQLVSLWWALWIGSGLVSNVAVRAWFDTNTPQDIQNADLLDLAASVISIVAGLLAIVIVRNVTGRQAERAQRLAATDGASSLRSASSPWAQNWPSLPS